jgi:hypothetical protein
VNTNSNFFSSNNDIITIKECVYNPCNFKFANFKAAKKSVEYGACSFEVNRLKVIARSAKITPKKVGQFVVIWKRKDDGPTEPYDIADLFDLLVINSRSDQHFGQFIFPKSVLLKYGIISNGSKDGKRGIRVYPPWDNPNNKQAEKTQQWQLNFFLSLDIPVDLQKARSLYINENDRISR